MCRRKGYLLHGVEQSDATGWMARYALAMTTIAAILHHSGHRPTLDLVQKFLEHFADIRAALDGQGMWDDPDGLFYDRIVTPSGDHVRQPSRPPRCSGGTRIGADPCGFR